MKWLLLPILLFNSKTVQAIDSGCTTTSNLSIYRCPEGSVDWYDGYTDLVDTLDALGDGLTSAGALKSSPTITGFNTGSVLFIGGSSKVNQNNGKFYWDDTNTRLGILTSSPTYPLHVEGAGNFLGQGVFGGSVTVKSDGMDVTGNARFRANIAADGDNTRGLTNNNLFVLNSSTIQINSSYGFNISTVSNTTSSLFRINPVNSRVGIGVLAPAYPLDLSGDFQGSGQGIFGGSVTVQSGGMDVSGNARFRANIAADGDNTLGLNNNSQFVLNSSTIQINSSYGLNIATASNMTSSAFRINAANNRVGIGVPAPSYPLDISGDFQSSGQVIVGTTVTVRGAVFSVGATTTTLNNGFLGLGFASPSYPVHVSGDSNFTGQGIFGGSITVQGAGLLVNGSGRIDGTITQVTASSLTVTGATTLSGDLTFPGTFQNRLVATGSATFYGNGIYAGSNIATPLVQGSGGTLRINATSSPSGTAGAALEVRPQDGLTNVVIVSSATGTPLLSISHAGNSIFAGSVTVQGAGLLVSGSARIDGTISQVTASSLTVTGGVTHSKACASGYSRVGVGMCIDTDGGWNNIVSSSPAGAGGSDAWTTVNDADLNSGAAKAAILRFRNILQQDATGEARTITLYLRQTGGGAARGASVDYSTVRSDLANEFNRDSGTMIINLDANSDFDYICYAEGGGAVTTNTCNIDVGGYIE